MKIDYEAESEKYRPNPIRCLLVGEAPPPSGQTYFYIPKALSEDIDIANDKSLPATIFYHYFQARPTTMEECDDFLRRLKSMGIFLIDICDEPIKVRNSLAGVERIIHEISSLREKMALRRIDVPDEKIAFLLARRNYERHIRKEFPRSKQITWKDFRMSSAGCL